MLKPGGLFFFTCASDGRPEHGTRRTSPNDSYGTLGNVEGWTDYYKNLNLTHLKEVFDLDKDFCGWNAYYNEQSKDLYFWGIKRTNDDSHVVKEVPSYTEITEHIVQLKGTAECLT